MKNFLQRLRSDNRGQDLIEYALLAGFVAIAAGAIMPDVTGWIMGVFDRINAAMAGQPQPNTPWPSSDWQLGRIICAVLAIAFLGVIVLRRKPDPD